MTDAHINLDTELLSESRRLGSFGIAYVESYRGGGYTSYHFKGSKGGTLVILNLTDEEAAALGSRLISQGNA